MHMPVEDDNRVVNARLVIDDNGQRVELAIGVQLEETDCGTGEACFVIGLHVSVRGSVDGGTEVAAVLDVE